MRQVNRALVVGAGIGGLTAAAALAQRGIETQVIDVKPDLAALGVGINQPANALRALRTLGVLEECLDHGFQFDRWVFTDRHGNVLVEVPSKLGDDGVPANSALPRPVLAQILTGAAQRAGAQFAFGTTVDQIVQEPDAAHVTLSDGSTENYDLVVGFDGIRSQLRRDTFGPAHDPVHTGFSVWRVTLERPPEVDCATMLQDMGTKAGLFPLSDKEMYLLINTPEPGNPWHEPAQFHELLRERLAGYTGLVGEIRESLTSPEGIVYAPTSEVFLPSPWYMGRVLILGDAAHACAPHGTQGAAMAIEDAVILAEELTNADALVGALAAFMDRRYPRCKYIQDASRQILYNEMDTTDQQSLQRRERYMVEKLRDDMQAMETVMNQPA